MILGADKKAAIANAKLKVFEEALLEQELGRDSELPSIQVPRIKHEERTSQWVDSSHMLSNPHTRIIDHTLGIHKNCLIPQNNQSPYHPQQ